MNGGMRPPGPPIPMPPPFGPPQPPGPGMGGPPPGPPGVPMGGGPGPMPPMGPPSPGPMGPGGGPPGGMPPGMGPGGIGQLPPGGPPLPPPPPLGAVPPPYPRLPAMDPEGLSGPIVLDEEPLDDIPDAILLQAMQSAYEQAKASRETRRRLNRRNWDAFHGKFDFILRKRPGQSALVIPSLETSLEQVCAELSQQLVGMSDWFSASYTGMAPPFPGLDADQAAHILDNELERLAVEGGKLPTSYGIGRLVYDSLKIGLLESEVCWKVMVVPEDAPVFSIGQGGALVQTSQTTMRLKIELVPYDDHFPDPSPAQHYDIHEVEVALADLPELGFADEDIEKMRHASPGGEKWEERRRRSGLAPASPQARHRVLLREYWGDVIHPQTGEMLAKEVFFLTAGGGRVIRKPVRIRQLLWNGKRPFLTIPLLPTPLAEVHHAFVDIARPLVEAESELTNLVIDAGFAAALGTKEIRSWMLEDPSVIAKGLVPGMELEVAQGAGDGDVVKRVDTGTLTPDMLNVLDRIARMRQEAFRINDLQLGRLPQRKESATEINTVEESGNDLFSNIALRFEDTGIEPLLELCWTLLWQFADATMIQRIGTAIGPENAQSLALLTPQERFVCFGSAVSFKVQGYKYQLQKVKDLQKLMMLRQQAATNPALLQVITQRFSPQKEYALIMRSLGIDPADIERDPDEPPVDPNLLAAQAGAPPGGGGGGAAANPAMNPAAAQTGPPPNPTGTRGIQLP